jgi:aryl-alcohol dehydrogenase-like predicted oxidoreductase
MRRVSFGSSATKVGLVSRSDGSRGVDLSSGHIERQLVQSLERLGRIDLYLSHRPDPSVPIEETLAVFAAAQDSGRIGAYGLSNVDRATLEAVLAAADARGFVAGPDAGSARIRLAASVRWWAASEPK